MDQYERQPDLYYPTGDVILSAPLQPAEGSERRLQVYRVHKTFLGIQSVFFANLFADASAGSGPTYDDLPMLEMPDRADDISGLLDCIYNPQHYLSRDSRYKTAFELIGITRLADKYLLDGLRAGLVQRVSEEWPKSLAEWNVRDAELDELYTASMVTCQTLEESAALQDRIPEPASAIMFAEEFGCPEILPAAFSFLARISIDNDWEVRPTDVPTCMRYARWSCMDNMSFRRYVRLCDDQALFCSRIVDMIEDGEMLSPRCIPWWTLQQYVPTEYHDSVPRSHDDAPYPCLRFIRKLRDAAWPRTSHEIDLWHGLRRLLSHKTPSMALCSICALNAKLPSAVGS